MTHARAAAEGASPAPRRPRLVHLDVLNVLAIPFVIFLHVRIAYWAPTDTAGWWFENLLSGIGALAVPVFFMNSGVTLVGFLERSTVGEFYSRRLKKVLIPYLVWAQLYLLFHVLIGTAGDVGIGTVARTAINGSSSAATLCYLEAAMGIYLVIPVVSLAVLGTRSLARQGRGETLLRLMLALSVLASIVLPAVRRFVPELLPSLSLPFGTEYLVYVLAGYVLSRSEIGPRLRALVYAGGIAGYLSFVLLGGKLMLAGSERASIFTDYLSPGTFAAACAVFLLARELHPERWPERARGLLARLAALTFGIYLVHLMVIEGADLLIERTTVASDVPMTVGVWAVSLVTVLLLRTIGPVRRWVLP